MEIIHSIKKTKQWAERGVVWTKRTSSRSVVSVREVLQHSLGMKPSLCYLEAHLVDHCNLNCKGCSHFCPVATKWFANTPSFAGDMRRLADLFSNIKVIRLLGGEPLLHPKIEDFIVATRNCFPKANLRIVTNGLLLDEMSDSFWQACKTNNVAVDLSLYPALAKREAALTELAASKGVDMRILRTPNFEVFYNLRGDSDAEANFKGCHRKFTCYNLREGKLYICPLPATAQYFNRWFGASIPLDGSVDIYDESISGWDIKRFLEHPASVCRYCAVGWKEQPRFPWDVSKKELLEWDASMHMTIATDLAPA